MRALNIRWLGNLPYAEALTLQKGLHNSVSDGNNEEDYLLLLEHNNVITLGRSGDKDNLIANKEKLDNLGIEYFETDRGCLLYTSPSPRDKRQSRMPSSA